MGPSPAYHPPTGEESETSVEHGLPLWAEPAVGYCSRRPRPSPMWGSRFVGAREVGPWVGEQKPLGKSPLRGNPSPESTYLPTYLAPAPAARLFVGWFCTLPPHTGQTRATLGPTGFGASGEPRVFRVGMSASPTGTTIALKVLERQP